MLAMRVHIIRIYWRFSGRSCWKGSCKYRNGIDRIVHIIVQEQQVIRMKKSWIILGVLIAGAIACGALALLYILPLDFSESSPVQPLFFSHKLHAGVHGIDCRYCHRHVADSRIAGIPSVEDCRSCHLYIAAESTEIIKLMNYWEKQDSIPWVRVNHLPDHVYFPHMLHIRAKIDCSHCHGDVRSMERITRKVSPKMGWCLDCHRTHKASIDCWTCHI